MRSTLGPIALLVLSVCGDPTVTEGGTAPSSLLADHELVLHGPLPTLGQHCNELQARVAEPSAVDSNALDFGCRTVVRAAGSEIPTLDGRALGDGFLHVKLFETGVAQPSWSGHLHLALHTKHGWYVSDAIVPIARSSEFVDGGPADAILEARELAPGPGREVSLHATGTEGSVLVGCRLDEDAEPRCVALGVSGTRTAEFVPGGFAWVSGPGDEASTAPRAGAHRW